LGFMESVSNDADQTGQVNIVSLLIAELAAGTLYSFRLEAAYCEIPRRYPSRVIFLGRLPPEALRGSEARK
jgi:hypothetical protein